MGSMWKYRGKAATGILVLAVVAWLVYLYRDELDGEALLAFGRGLPAGWFIAALFVLPILGVPITPILLLAGARFGLLQGSAVTALAMVFHSLVAYYLTKGYLRDRLRGWLEKRGYRIPSMAAGDQAWFTVMTAATPGPPYAAKLLLLAMTEISLGIYFWAGLPVYFLFGLIPLGAGSAAMDLNAGRISACVALGIALIHVGRWLAARHARSHRERPT